MTSPNLELIEVIAKIGEKFFDSHEDTVFGKDVKENPTIILNNWWLSTQLFYKHLFLRGRSDKISIEFYRRFICYLINRQNISLDEWPLSDFEKFVDTLDEVVFKDELLAKNNSDLKNSIDRDMIVSVMRFIRENGNPAVYVFNTEIQKAHVKLKEIYGVGDKLASFYIRNIYKLYKKEEIILHETDDRIRNEKIMCLLPIDTWIAKICFLTGMISQIDNSDNLQKKFSYLASNLSFDVKFQENVFKQPRYLSEVDKSKIKQIMIDICSRNNINPMDFNQGAWCIGFYSLPIVISMINHNNVGNIKFDYKELIR